MLTSPVDSSERSHFDPPVVRKILFSQVTATNITQKSLFDLASCVGCGHIGSLFFSQLALFRRFGLV